MNNTAAKDLFDTMGKDIMQLTEDTARVDVPKLYSKIGEDYDRAMTAINYNDPFVVVDVIRRLDELDPKSTRAIDFGCGQGIMGRKLNQLGFENMDAIDATPKFCDLVRRQGIYRKVENIWVGSNDSSFPASLQNQYDLVVSSGCFIKNHFPKYVFDDMYAAAKHGGVVVFAVRDDHYDEDLCLMGYGQQMKKLEEEGKYERISRAPYDKNPSKPADEDRGFDPYYKPVKGSVHVFRVNKKGRKLN